MKKTLKGSEELAEESMKERSSQKKIFDSSSVKQLSKEITIKQDEKNKTTIQRVELEGKKYLSIRKFYKKMNSWFPGKGVWLNDESVKQVLTEGLKLYK